jgi:microcystin-dependent protein
MPYTPTTWTDEQPSATPIKYKITDDIDGILASSAIIELLTGVTAGTALSAANMNKLEQGVVMAQATAEAAFAAALTIQAITSAIYPVGSIVAFTVSTNPATLLGVGTWEAFGAGRVLVGNGTSDTSYSAGATGGESNHTLTSAEMPSHTHTQNAHTHTQNAHTHALDGYELRRLSYGTDEYLNVIPAVPGPIATGSTAATNQNTTPTNQNTGGDGSHNNMPPYIVVYRWVRIS